MKFKELKFVNGICQLDYNYYVISFTKYENNNFYSCTIFNRAKLPVDLPGIKTEVMDAFESQNEQDLTDDNLQYFFERIKKNVSKTASITLVDPFDEKGK